MNKKVRHSEVTTTYFQLSILLEMIILGNMNPGKYETNIDYSGNMKPISIIQEI